MVSHLPSGSLLKLILMFSINTSRFGHRSLVNLTFGITFQSAKVSLVAPNIYELWGEKCTRFSKTSVDLFMYNRRRLYITLHLCSCSDLVPLCYNIVLVLLWCCCAGGRSGDLALTLGHGAPP